MYCRANRLCRLKVDVAGSFEAMRWYLREAKLRMDRIHPRLRDNAGLVARLVDYEAPMCMLLLQVT